MAISMGYFFVELAFKHLRGHPGCTSFVVSHVCLNVACCPEVTDLQYRTTSDQEQTRKKNKVVKKKKGSTKEIFLKRKKLQHKPNFSIMGMHLTQTQPLIFYTLY